MPNQERLFCPYFCPSPYWVRLAFSCHTPSLLYRELEGKWWVGSSPSSCICCPIMRSSPGEEVYHASEQVVEVGARRGCVRQESSDISPLAPYFQTSALTVMEAAISPFSLEEVKSSVYLTAKIPGIPPGPSLNIPKRLDYSPQSELLSLNAKATAHVWGGVYWIVFW